MHSVEVPQWIPLHASNQRPHDMHFRWTAAGPSSSYSHFVTWKFCWRMTCAVCMAALRTHVCTARAIKCTFVGRHRPDCRTMQAAWRERYVLYLKNLAASQSTKHIKTDVPDLGQDGAAHPHRPLQRLGGHVLGAADDRRRRRCRQQRPHVVDAALGEAGHCAAAAANHDVLDNSLRSNAMPIKSKLHRKHAPRPCPQASTRARRWGVCLHFACCNAQPACP